MYKIPEKIYKILSNECLLLQKDISVKPGKKQDNIRGYECCRKMPIANKGQGTVDQVLGLHRRGSA